MIIRPDDDEQSVTDERGIRRMSRANIRRVLLCNIMAYSRQQHK